MIKFFVLFSLNVFFVLSLQSGEYYTILNRNDYQELQDINSTGPIHTSLDTSFEAYMEWVCLETDNIEIACLEYIFPDKKIVYVPNIMSTQGEVQYYYGAIPDFSIDCDEVLLEWDKLINESNQICMMSARVPTYASKIIASDIYAIKTNRGYWRAYFENQ